MRTLLLHFLLVAACLAALPVAARAEALDSGIWDTPYGRVRFEREGGKLVGRLSEPGRVCGLSKGDEVLRGAVDDDLFTGEARVCYPGKCSEPEWVLALALEAKTPVRWIGGALEPGRGCAASPRGAFKLERPKVSSMAAALPANQAGKFKSKEAEALFVEARAARGSFDLRGALKALKIADGKEPDHPDILLEMADVYRQLKDYDRARESLLRAARKDKRYAFYNLACLEASLHNPKQALSYLEKSVNAGWDRYDDMRGDSDLDSLQRTPEFEALLAKVQRNARSHRR